MENAATIKANRLIGLKNHPGFNELIRIGEELVNQASAMARDYPGWDPMQLMVLQSRAKAAAEYHSLWISTMMQRIQEGIAASIEQEVEAQMKEPHNAIEDADELRKVVLARHEGAEARVPGSY